MSGAMLRSSAPCQPTDLAPLKGTHPRAGRGRPELESPEVLGMPAFEVELPDLTRAIAARHSPRKANGAPTGDRALSFFDESGRERLRESWMQHPSCRTAHR
jgi:hypothetical protein